ncbi:MAG: DUF2213 domain-containing protein [Sandaracinaceae bacterium]
MSRPLERFDFASASKLAKVVRTPAGGVRLAAVIARAGVLTYEDGTRELVTPDELARADSLASLRDAPVTVGHPPAEFYGGSSMVTPESYRELTVGHVSGEPRVVGDHVVAEIVVMDATAIARIDAGELVEISAGYGLRLEEAPGVFRGERYDAIQRNRTYNHIALLPAGSGRAGPTVRLRLDSRRAPHRHTHHQDVIDGREPPVDISTRFRR